MKKVAVKEIKYGVYGPFPILFKPNDDDDIIKGKPFWQSVIDISDEKKLPEAHGCYIFGIKVKGDCKPWYIGRTKNSFRDECFKGEKVGMYEKIINKHNGDPFLLLVAEKKPKGGLKTSPVSSQIEKEIIKLETILITLGYLKHVKIKNKQIVKLLEKIGLREFIGKKPGKGTLKTAVATLRSLLTKKKPKKSPRKKMKGGIGTSLKNKRSRRGKRR